MAGSRFVGMKFNTRLNSGSIKMLQECVAMSLGNNKLIGYPDAQVNGYYNFIIQTAAHPQMLYEAPEPCAKKVILYSNSNI